MPVGTLNVPFGTQNLEGVQADAVHVTAYRAAGPGYFTEELQAAVTLRPRFLILTAWNEFGSASDEPSPDESWTIMSNNKYGGHCAEILPLWRTGRCPTPNRQLPVATMSS